MGNDVVQMLSLTLQAFDNPSDEHLQKIFDLEDTVNALDKLYTENHIKRHKTEKSDPRGGVAFVGMVSDLERVADHAKNIAYYFQDRAV